MKKRLSTTLVLLLLSPFALAASLQLKSPEQQIGLLELYTSEGCSSCPPAERWLSGLKDNVHLWKVLSTYASLTSIIQRRMSIPLLQTHVTCCHVANALARNDR